jgi:hypothetical protein
LKLFSIELDNINGVMTPRVELDYKFKSLEQSDIVKIHDLISNCYVEVMKIYISKTEVK